MPRKAQDDRTLSLWDEQELPEFAPARDSAKGKSKNVKPRRKRILLYEWLLWFVRVSFGLLGVTILIAMGIRLERELSTSSRFVLTMPATLGEDSPNIEIKGLKYTDRAALNALFEPDYGRSIYFVPLQQRRDQIAQLPWVKQASVRRIWPSKILVNLQERVPAAFVLMGERYLLMDEDGVLMPAPKMQLSLPVMIGVRSHHSDSERREQVRRVLAFVKEVGPLFASVSEVDASDPRDLKVIRKVGDRALVLSLGASKHRERLQFFDQSFPQIIESEPNKRAFRVDIGGEVTSTTPEAILGH